MSHSKVAARQSGDTCQIPIQEGGKVFNATCINIIFNYLSVQGSTTD